MLFQIKYLSKNILFFRVKLESFGKRRKASCQEMLIEHQVFKVYFQFHRVCFNVDSGTHRNCVDDGNASRRKRHATRRKRGNVSGESFLDEGTKRRGNNGRNAAAFTAPYDSDLHLPGYYP